MEEQISNINSQIEYVNKDSSTFNEFISDIDNGIIIFCNPISGNQEGKIFLGIAEKYKSIDNFQYIDFSKIQLSSDETPKPLKVLLFNLVDKSENQKGQTFLKDCVNYIINTQSKSVVITLIAGGDGSVLSMVLGFKNNGIDITKCVFGHVPLGTGNDLSNSLGFGNHVDIIEDDVTSLYTILKKYHSGEKGKIDVWRLKLKLDPVNGYLIQNSNEGKTQMKNEDGSLITTYERTFINYLSFGYDASVGFGFDGRRTKSRCCNKCIYFCEGCKRMCCCCNSLSVEGFLDCFGVLKEDPEEDKELIKILDGNAEKETEKKIVNLETSINNITHNTTEFFSQQQDSNGSVHLDFFENKILPSKYKYKYLYMFKPKNSLKPNESDKKVIVLKGDPVSIVCQNILHYMAGAKDIWNYAGRNMSLEILHTKTIEEKEKYENKLTKIADKPQSFSDKKLEFFSFDNGLETGFEKVIGGQAKKLYHGEGPVLISFKKIVDNYDNKKRRIYFNVDGEYFRLVQPKSILIKLDRTLCNGQIPIIVNRKKE